MSIHDPYHHTRRFLTPAAVLESSTWLVCMHAQSNVWRACVQRPSLTIPTATVDSAGRLDRGVLWQRLTCMVECLDSWIPGFSGAWGISVASIVSSRRKYISFSVWKCLFSFAQTKSKVCIMHDSKLAYRFEAGSWVL
jgi:hypothetical protein